jgi:hypothetical protein
MASSPGLPIWTLEQDHDLQAWLFRFGAGIPIEKPESLRDLQRKIAEDEVAIYGDTKLSRQGKRSDPLSNNSR